MNKESSKHITSQMLCEQFNIDYIDFSIPENFIKLMDLIFQYKKTFQLIITKRTKNFLEDVLNILWEEIEEAKYEKPIEVKEFACLLRNEYFNDGNKQ
ncbi:MAG: hypothetical protein Q4E83_03795 [bacterium]|nr:hypothetical protein [bacterium]